MQSFCTVFVKEKNRKLRELFFSWVSELLRRKGECEPTAK